jgi:uncharacterized protein involved in exopolysaccharide biosynthesis/Mrp family chromosome partitioning ATPase
MSASGMRGLEQADCMATRAARNVLKGAEGKAPPEDSMEMDPHDLVRMLWRHKYVILGTVLAAIAAVLFYLARATPLYTATTTIEVKTGQDLGAQMQGAARAMTPQDEVRIATHMELLRSPVLGQDVVRDLNLDKDAEFVPADLDASLPDDKDEAEAVRLAAVTEQLFDRVQVARVGQSALISVSATTTDPEKSAEIANVIAGTHRKNLVREQKSVTKREIAAAEDRAGTLRREALEGERMAVAQSKAAGAAGGLDSQSAISTAGLSAQLSEAKAARAAAETRFSQLGRIGGGVAGPGSAASPLLADLRSQQATLDKRIAELSAQFGPGHPDLRAATAQQAEISSRLVEEMARVRQEAAAEVSAARAREGQIAADLAAAQGRVTRAADASVTVSDLQHSASTNRQLYLSQLARLQELRGEENSLRPDASIVAKALVPIEPASPKPGRLLAVAVAGGLLLGLVLAFAVEVMDRRIRTSLQVRRITGLNTLALVPELTAGRADVDPLVQLREEPGSAFSETIRSLMLDVVGYVRGVGRVLVITSSLPKEGKTLLSVSIGAAAALSGRRTVVVDLDLRRPAVASMLKVEIGEADLNQCLTMPGVLDSETVSAAIVPHPEVDRLSVLGARELPADAGSLLASERVDDLIRILRKRYDLVVLNAPPILPVRDAKYLARLSDVCLLVVRWGRTGPDALRAASEILGRSVTAAVINRVNLKRHADSKYGDQLQHFQSYASYYGGRKEAA